MEIPTAPHRPATTPWGRLLALVVIIGPVSVLVLLPLGLGLQRYVMSGSSMDGGRDDSIPRGAVVFEREVPVNDLRVGDVVTYRPPPATGIDGIVTHRIVAIGPEGIVTKGDAEPVRDPWVLRPEGGTLPRVVFTLPWIGYGYLALVEPLTWAIVLGIAVAAVVLMAGEGVRRRRRVAPADDQPGTAPSCAGPSTPAPPGTKEANSE